MHEHHLQTEWRLSYPEHHYPQDKAPRTLRQTPQGVSKMHRPILFNELVLSDKLFEHCAEIDEAARNRMELIVPELAKRNGVTEQMKSDNQMEWVRQMNACKAQAEAIVKFELIYD